MWQQAYLENRVMSAEPVELICMLYERAIELAGDARRHLATGDVLARSSAISKTLGILAELEGSLDHQAGGNISQNLERLYQHMRTRLMTANVKQQDRPLAEVESLLKTMSEAWEGVRSKAGKSEFDPAPLSGNPWGGHMQPEVETHLVGEGWKA